MTENSIVWTAGLKYVTERWLPSDATAAFGWLAKMNDVSLRTDTARAVEGVILQQPAEIQKQWLEKADSGLRAELERQRPQALLDEGDDIPEPSPPVE